MNQAPLTQNIEENPAKPIENVEEVTPLDIIASLERDNAIQQAALRKILRMNPALFKGGDTNKYFGRKHEQAFEECRKVAHGALSRLENYTDE